MTMDIDPPANQEQKVLVHPLAIVNMSDQYTRITCGGSPLNPTAPVVGLLFGTVDTENAAIRLMDSDDIPVVVEHKEAAAQQVTLHQAVFPQHQVLGWYRVVSAPSTQSIYYKPDQENQPSANDLQLMIELQRRYYPDSTSTTNPTFVFSLLQAASKDEGKGKKLGQKDDSSAEKDKELPFTLYKLSPNQTSLIAIEDWSLETSPAERIGLEHVVRYQPPRRRKTNPLAENDSGKGNAAEPVVESMYCDSTKEVQHSLQMIQARLGVLERFLVDTQGGKIPLHPELLREVQGLIWQLGPLSAGLMTSSAPSTIYSVEDMVQQLAILTRTVDAVLSYTDKVRSVMDSSRPPREGRRGMAD